MRANLFFGSIVVLAVIVYSQIFYLNQNKIEIKNLKSQIVAQKANENKVVNKSDITIIEPDLQDKNINAYCYSHSKDSTEFTSCKSGAHLKYVFSKGVK